jgi:16S rRNA processing protein RimM
VEHAARRLTTEQERGLGGQGRAPEPRYLIVGEVLGAHGLDGELKVELTTDDPHRFRWLDRVFVGPEDEEPVARPLKGYRLHKGRALIRLEGCNDRTTAEAFRGMLLQVPREEAIPLEEGEYFEHQILGLAVWTLDGEHLGQVTEIIYTGANDVYVVRSAGPDRREILIPAIADVVLRVDLEAGSLTVALPEGLR